MATKYSDLSMNHGDVALNMETCNKIKKRKRKENMNPAQLDLLDARIPDLSTPYYGNKSIDNDNNNNNTNTNNNKTHNNNNAA